MKKQDNQKALLTVSDTAIIELYWQRNEQAIQATDRKYGAYLYRIACNILRDRLDCEECVNDTYLTTWNKIPPERPNALQLFLTKIARDLSIDRYRKNKAARRVPSELIVSLDEMENSLPYDDSASEEALRRLVELINRYLQEMSKEDAFIFVCRYYYADSVEYIAQLLKVSKPTVYRSLARLREGLRVFLEQEGVRI